MLLDKSQAMPATLAIMHIILREKSMAHTAQQSCVVIYQEM